MVKVKRCCGAAQWCRSFAPSILGHTEKDDIKPQCLGLKKLGQGQSDGSCPTNYISAETSVSQEMKLPV